MIALMTDAITPPKPPVAPADDLEMTHAAGAGDPNAQRRVVDRLINRVRSSVFYLAGGHPDAEDWAQLAMIEILQSIGSFRGDSSLEGWAERIVVRTAMRHIKRTRWRGQIVGLDPEPNAVVESHAEDDVSHRRSLEKVSHILGELKPKYREVVTLHMMLGHTIAEIAKMTNTNFNTVRYRLRVGRKQLRRTMRRDPSFRERFADGEVGS